MQALEPKQDSEKAPFNTARLRLDRDRVWDTPSVQVSFRVDEVRWLRTPDGVLHRWRKDRLRYRRGEWKREKP